MDKLLLFPGKTEKGIFTHLIDYERSYLTKTASQGAYHPTIASYIGAAKTIPGKTQILLTALGAGEYWGDNANGDYFPESELAYEGDEDYGYRTFTKHAKIYKHHVNKNPAAAFGDVPLAVYNPAFHRVELIVLLDNAKAPDIAEQIEHGNYPDWSMGTRIPYDVCSICGNKAPNMKFYCHHAKYQMGRIDPETGKKVFVRNYKPKFFDISYVLIGADRIAKTLKKVAHARPIYYGVSSAALAEKSAELAKGATIEKQVPAGDPQSPPSSQTALREIARTIPEVKAREKRLPKEVLDGLAKMPLSRSLSTMTMLGILPKPEEFQRLYLLAKGLRELADALERKALCFDPMMKPDPDAGDMGAFDISHRHFDEDGMRMLTPYLPERSYASPHLSKRIAILIKTGSASRADLPTFIKIGEDGKPTDRTPLGIVPLMLAAAGAYAALSKKAPAGSLHGVDKLLQSNAGLGLATALGIGLLSVFHSTFGPKVKGQFNTGDYTNPDANDTHARIEDLKQKPYLKLGGAMQNLGAAGRRLFLGIPAAYMGSGVLAAHRDANPYETEGRMSAFLRQHPDLVSGGLIADAMMSARGGGTHGVIRKAVGTLKKVAEDQADTPDAPLKTAFLQDSVSNALIWPLATGRVNLPGKIVGGVIDSTLLAGLSRLGKKDKPERN